LLPTVGAAGNFVADFNLDGYLDILFGSSDYEQHAMNPFPSYLYLGSADGYSADNRLELEARKHSLPLVELRRMARSSLRFSILLRLCVASVFSL
jgi:hypothetical protein